MIARLSKRNVRRPRRHPTFQGRRAGLALAWVLSAAWFSPACGGTHFSAGSAGMSGASESGNSGAGETSQAGASGASEDGGASEGGSIAAGGTSGGQTGTGGKGSGGGRGGSAGKGGGSSSAGASAAGAGGKATTGCDCAAGNYCQDGVNRCRSCADFTRFEFGAPEKLATLSQASSERFPRAASAGSDLFYRSGALGMERLWYAPTPVSGIGAEIGSSGAGGDSDGGTSEATTVDSGPLLAPGFVAQNFFFDRTDPGTSLRHLMMGVWQNGALNSVIVAPKPFNDVASDFSVAVAPGVGRVYWMSTRSGKPAAELLWVDSIGSDAIAPSVFDVQVQAGAASCPRLGDDATPWVNVAGTLLLMRSESVDDSCQPNDSGAFDLYAVPLAPSGAPAAAGIPLSTLNNTGGASTETDPSLSQDSCLIYFASDNGTQNFDLYRAARN